MTVQDEALRPFVAVLRHSDSVGVRERCVHCIALATTSHPRGLGSGKAVSHHGEQDPDYRVFRVLDVRTPAEIAELQGFVYYIMLAGTSQPCSLGSGRAHSTLDQGAESGTWSSRPESSMQWRDCGWIPSITLSPGSGRSHQLCHSHDSIIEVATGRLSTLDAGPHRLCRLLSLLQAGGRHCKLWQWQGQTQRLRWWTLLSMLCSPLSRTCGGRPAPRAMTGMPTRCLPNLHTVVYILLKPGKLMGVGPGLQGSWSWLIMASRSALAPSCYLGAQCYL